MIPDLTLILMAHLYHKTILYIWAPCPTLGGGGGGGVILVRCWSQFFETYPNHILGRKKMTYSYTWLNKMFTYSYTVLWFLYTLFAVCIQSLQINITILVSELNISAKIWVFSNRDVRKRNHSYNNDEKLGQSYIGSAEKGGYSARTSILCHKGSIEVLQQPEVSYT